jgi:MYXO-CTERM domain-containing protein
MRRVCLVIAFGIAIVGAAGLAQAVTFDTIPSSPWGGFMNVTDLPADGGAYKFGSGWGTADLTAVFTGPVLTLGPNSVNDISNYWYKGEGLTPGGPGAPGNKNMDANYYVEFPAGTNNGTNIVFQGKVLANSLVAPYTSVAFIKDFAPDYSSNVTITIPLAVGPFSIMLDTIADPLRHVQYGFETIGPNVWITDRAPIGEVQVTSAVTLTPGDFDGNGTVNGLDLSIWRAANAAHTTAGDTDADGDSDGNDFLVWQHNQQAASVGASAAAPEPASAILAVVGLGLLGASRRRRRAS